MIRVNLYEDQDGLCGFLCEGHAGYAEVDEIDVVCAGVTSIAATTVTALEDILGLEVDSDFREGSLYCSILNITDDKKEQVELLLRSFEIGCKQIEFSYGSDYVQVSPKTVKIK